MSTLGRSALPWVLLLAAAALPAACTFPEYEFVESAAGGAPSGGDGGTSGAAGTGAGMGMGGSGGVPAPSCDDAMKNGLETDVDCGGRECPLCANDQRCVSDADCASQRCDPIDRRCRPGLVVRCRCTENCAAGSQAFSKMEFSLANRSPNDIPLEGVVLRYYFTRENPSDQALCTTTALPGGCAAMGAEQRTYENATATATHVFELVFSSQNGDVTANTPTGITGIELRAMQGENVMQLNDYSFYESPEFSPPVLDCDRITLHRINGQPGGALIWGIPPEQTE